MGEAGIAHGLVDLLGDLAALAGDERSFDGAGFAVLSEK
jgi:hypothetical protein